MDPQGPWSEPDVKNNKNKNKIKMIKIIKIITFFAKSDFNKFLIYVINRSECLWAKLQIY